MAKLPKFLHTPSGSPGSGQARATDIRGMSDTGQVTRANTITRAGQDIIGTAETWDKKLEDDANQKTDEITSGAKDFVSQQEADILTQGIGSAEDQPGIINQMSADFKKHLDDKTKGLSQRVKNKVNDYYLQANATYRDYIRKVTSAKLKDQYIAGEVKLAGSEALSGDVKASHARIDAMVNVYITPKQAIAMKLELEKNNIGALTEQGRFEEAKELTRTSKAFDPTERISQLNFINIEEKRLKSKTQDLSYAQQMEVNSDFVSRIGTKELSPDDVQNSNLDDKPKGGLSSFGRLSKESWIRYVESSTGPAPSVTTPSGHSDVTQAVFDFITNNKDKETTYKSILDARYINQDITEDDFNWAMDKIENPYSKSVATDLENVFATNTKEADKWPWVTRFSPKEKEQAKKTNTALVNWVDEEIKEGRTPNYDQMYQKSARLIAGSGDSEQTATPKTAAEYETLKSGTLYIDSKDGLTYRKK